MTSLLGEDRKITASETSVESVINLVETERVRLVRFIFCDTSGLIRGKAAHVDHLRERLSAGIGLVKGTMAQNLLDQLQSDTGYGATGEVRLTPDLNTFVALPYSAQSAAVICDLLELDRKPSSLCPRSALKRQIKRAEELGIRIECAFEPEFTLGRLNEEGKYVPIDESNCFSTDGMNRAAQFINRFMSALEKQGVEIELYHPELGHGQHELSVRHVPALRAADQQIIYRETLRGVALEHGIQASMAPKPMGSQQPGNGCHLHLSAWDIETGKNLFFSSQGLSTAGEHFVGGLIQHLPGLVALTAPTVNSYRRLRPRTWSGAYTCWGYENREATIRVPSQYWGMEEATTNIEIKCVDSSCNPYLALTGVIAAGLDGLRTKIAPPPPVSVEPSTLSSSQMEKLGVKRLPATLKDAIKRLERDHVLTEALGEDLSIVFVIVKLSEVEAFSKASSEEETRAHRFKF